MKFDNFLSLLNCFCTRVCISIEQDPSPNYRKKWGYISFDRVIKSLCYISGIEVRTGVLFFDFSHVAI